MTEVLQQFANAAREIESLLGSASQLAVQEDAAPLAAWVLNAKNLLDRTNKLIAGEGPQIAALKSTLEARLYRKQLELLKQKIEAFEQDLLTRSLALRGQQQQASGFCAWADMVSKLS